MTSKKRILLVVSILVVILGVVLGTRSFVQPSMVNETHSNESSAQKAPASEPTVEVTASPTPASSFSIEKLNVEDQKKLSVLNEIFFSKNDNDPRMDSELVRLSPELKAAMVQTYRALPAERRNERGTIAFLIGREVKSNEDVQFLKSILMEKPCLSLSDCSRPAVGSHEDVHLDGTNEMTANYPQLMATRQLLASYRKLVDQDASSSLAAGIVQSLRDAVQSPNPRVSDEARRALQAMGKDL